VSRSLLVGAALVGLVVSGVVAPAAAQAAQRARVCPTENFVVGEGWGADRGRRAHTGIDLGGKRGTPIYAIEDGVIDRTKLQSNGALQIVMKGESGSKFYYGHMDEVLIAGGQRVKAGDVIGLMGDTGSPGAVHLHFEYWRSGGESAAVNPEPLVKRVCDVSANGMGDSDDSTAVAVKPAAPTVKPDEPALDPDIAGDVFQN